MSGAGAAVLLVEPEASPEDGAALEQLLGLERAAEAARAARGHSRDVGRGLAPRCSSGSRLAANRCRSRSAPRSPATMARC